MTVLRSPLSATLVFLLLVVVAALAGAGLPEHVIAPHTPRDPGVLNVSVVTNTPNPTATIATAASSPTASATPAPLPTDDWLTGRYLPRPEGKWIEIDLTNQRLIAHEDANSAFTITIASVISLPEAAVGRFQVSAKYRQDDFSGPGYLLPKVPWVVEISPDVSILGAYWLEHFGKPVPNGSINLPPDEAARLFEWVDPPLPEGSESVASSEANPGGWVLIHR